MPEFEHIEVDPDSLPDEGEALGPVHFEGEPARSAAELYMNSPAVRDRDRTRVTGGAIVGTSLAV
ncbi:hypothetical protein KBD20_04485 [Candidatus Saccharibacteria bacterium]|nr:hypothetical protein [Candidatus Saccharibacteria bacterium]